MQPLIHKILVVHIAFAMGCALSFWPPFFLAKGGRWHLRIGKIYCALLALMTSTALTITIMSYLDAEAATHRPDTGMLLDRFRHDVFEYRAHLVFLGFIAIGTVQALAFGLRSLKVTPNPGEPVVHAILGTTGLLIVALGVVVRFLPMSVVGLVGAIQGAFFAVRSKRVTQSSRLADHLTGMIQSGVLAYSAIAIVVANRRIPEFFHGPNGIVIWVLPTLIGLPAILILRRKHLTASPP